jgi:hypothetical protein
MGPRVIEANAIADVVALAEEGPAVQSGMCTYEV